LFHDIVDGSSQYSAAVNVGDGVFSEKSRMIAEECPAAFLYQYSLQSHQWSGDLGRHLRVDLIDSEGNLAGSCQVLNDGCNSNQAQGKLQPAPGGLVRPAR
jgi:hypothetical protein